MSFLSRGTGYQSGDVVSDRCRIIEPLGQGSSGITYRAEDLNTQLHVALKVMSLQQMDDWKRFELFEREAKVLAQLDHPKIPKYLDYLKLETINGGLFCLAQELAEGLSLSELVERGWRANEAEAKQIAENVLEVLIYLHALTPPVIHRDIKPQNIIRREDGQISLVDFGAVQDVYRDTMLGGSTVVGTFGYMAPEQFRGRAVPATDLYGLGATLAFLMTQQSPADLPEKDLKIDVRACVNASPQFLAWLGGLLEPSCDRRFKSASEARDLLQGKRISVSSQEFDSNPGFKSTVQTVRVAGQSSPRLLIHIPATRLDSHAVTLIALDGVLLIAIPFLARTALGLIFALKFVVASGIVGLLVLGFLCWLISSAIRSIFAVFTSFGAVSIDITRGRMLITREGFWGKHQLPKIIPQDIHLVDASSEKGIVVSTFHGRYSFGTALNHVDRARLTHLITTFVEEVSPRDAQPKIDQT